RDPDNATSQLSLASLYSEIGAIFRRQGKLTYALNGHRKAYTIRKRLAAKDSSNPRRQNDLAKSATAIADVLVEQNDDVGEVLTLYREAIAIQNEARPHYDEDTFHLHIKIGDILFPQRDSEDESAFNEYVLAWSIAHDFTKSDSSSEKWQGNLITACIKIGD